MTYLMSSVQQLQRDFKFSLDDTRTEVAKHVVLINSTRDSFACVVGCE